MIVGPIRNNAKLKHMHLFLNEKNMKYGLLLKLGLNTCLRIVDILKY